MEPPVEPPPVPSAVPPPLPALMVASCAAGNDAALKRLALVDDDEGVVTLFCLVAVYGDTRDARLALRSFDQQWWLGHCDQTSGKLNFDFDLV